MISQKFWSLKIGKKFYLQFFFVSLQYVDWPYLNCKIFLVEKNFGLDFAESCSFSRIAQFCLRISGTAFFFGSETREIFRQSAISENFPIPGDLKNDIR